MPASQDVGIRVLAGGLRSSDSDNVEVIDPVKFVEIVTIKDVETNAAHLDPFIMVIVNFKNAPYSFGDLEKYNVRYLSTGGTRQL